MLAATLSIMRLSNLLDFLPRIEHIKFAKLCDSFDLSIVFMLNLNYKAFELPKCYNLFYGKHYTEC